MSEPHVHATHPALVSRLRHAEGHLRHVIAMIEQGRPCNDIATQLHAVERAVTAAKRTLIHDHVDHCLGDGGARDLAEMRALTIVVAFGSQRPDRGFLRADLDGGWSVYGVHWKSSRERSCNAADLLNARQREDQATGLVAQRSRGCRRARR